MADEIRYQRKCFYASPAYSESFWGKYIYLYQGKGSLRLTTDSLNLEDCAQAVEIPFHAVKSIGVGRVSTWAKPFGLTRLDVSYTRDGETRGIYLVPYESAFAPTWDTSKLVASWCETLGKVEALTNRVAPAEVDPSASPSIGTRIMIAALLFFVIPFGCMTLGWFLAHR